MVERSIPVSLQRELEKQESAEAILAFLTISHPTLEDDIRVVTDSTDYTRSTGLFQGFWFDIELLSDNDRPPVSRLEVQNVDRAIGNVLKTIVEAPILKLELLAMSDFDLTADPRTVLTSESEVYVADNLFLVNVSVDDLFIKGDIVSWAYVQEEFPSRRATQARTPALFR